MPNSFARAASPTLPMPQSTVTSNSFLPAAIAVTASAVSPYPSSTRCGNVIADLGAEQPQTQPEDGGAGHAVNVIIAVDEDSTPGGDSGVDPFGGRAASRQQVRIAQGGEFRIEKIASESRIGHAAADQQLSHDRRNASSAPNAAT